MKPESISLFVATDFSLLLDEEFDKIELAPLETAYSSSVGDKNSWDDALVNA